MLFVFDAANVSIGATPLSNVGRQWFKMPYKGKTLIELDELVRKD
jgi:hypothetical protein